MNRLTPLCSAMLLLYATPVFAAQVDFSVSFNDPDQAYTKYYDEIRTITVAAGEEWANDLITTVPSTLNVEIDFGDNRTVAGSSTNGSFVGVFDSIPTEEQGAAYTILTGKHLNGTGPDIRFVIGGSYLENTLWFDPEPTERSASVPVPEMMIDAYSTFLHEFGHAFAFNGLRDLTTGVLRGNKQSTFDQNIVNSGGYLYFIGSEAEAVYGGPVPLTYENFYHVANKAPGPGSNLILDLMNGAAFYYTKRYYISPLDLAIVTDTGLPTKAFSTVVPEPDWVSGTGILALGLTCSLLKRKLAQDQKIKA